ncbi:MAG: DUF4147 domain-containing protein [Syntrophobacterales bacterium]|nr:DUF4147 domain-containing protein [Syntrophobacterales bacterium]
MNSRQIILDLFIEAVQAAMPDRILRRALAMDGDDLIVLGKRHPMKKGRGVYVFGSGKASAPAALAVEEIIGARIAGGLIISNSAEGRLKKVAVRIGAHPVPDERSLLGAEGMAESLSSSPETMCSFISSREAVPPSWKNRSHPLPLSIFSLCRGC